MWLSKKLRWSGDDAHAHDVPSDRSGPDAADQYGASRYQPLLVLFAAVAVGIVADRLLPSSFWSWWVLGVVGLIAWRVLGRAARHRMAAVALLLAVSSVGAAWHHIHWYLFPADDLSYFARHDAQPACVVAVARAAPVQLPGRVFGAVGQVPQGARMRVELHVTAIRDGREWRPASGITTLDVEGKLSGVELSGMEAGARLKIFAALEGPIIPMNPGQPDFQQHFRADRQLCRLSADYAAGVTVVEPASRWSLQRLADRVRHYGQSILRRNLSPETDGLGAAMLLGMRDEVPRSEMQRFVTTGTVHLLVVSGLHLGILAFFLSGVLRFGLMSRRSALVLVVVVVCAYAVIAEARPPVVRAAAIVTLFCVARIAGRHAVRYNALAAAALIVLFWNPADLFRVGPQLSFLAVATLIWWSPRLTIAEATDPLDRLIADTRRWYQRGARALMRRCWQMTLASAAIWLVVLPLIMAQFHVISPVAVLLNAVLWLPIAIGMGAGFCTLLFGWLAPPLGALCGAVCSACFGFIDAVVTLGDEFSVGHAWTPGPPTWWVGGFYLGLAALVFLPRWRPPRRWCWAALAAWIAVGFGAALASHRDRDELQCTFVSVGHGCAVVLEFPGGQTMLYDAGSLGSPEGAAGKIASVLWSQGITRLDAVVLSHADADHFNAMPELMERFSIGSIYVSPVMFAPAFQTGGAAALDHLQAKIQRRGVPVQTVWAGDRLSVSGDVRVDVLHPPERGVLGGDNANSVVLLVEYAGRRILLPGDLETPGLEDVTAELPIDCDVVLAPHHGSRRSDPPGFAAWSRPDWVVVSGGRRHSRDDEVADAYRQSGAEVVHTADVGAVRFTISGAVSADSGKIAGEIKIWRWRDE